MLALEDAQDRGGEEAWPASNVSATARTLLGPARRCVVPLTTHPRGTENAATGTFRAATVPLSGTLSMHDARDEHPVAPREVRSALHE
ncbi:MAG TPA: hypothetical protein VGR11_07675 [Solirubrobacteraceae bacterium]|nr:hypothetical protein [Solirubrobacteraceae bacterium]